MQLKKRVRSPELVQSETKGPFVCSHHGDMRHLPVRAVLVRDGDFAYIADARDGSSIRAPLTKRMNGFERDDC